jgi:GntR family transcriptional regulator/MocR family aminotransferase
VAWPNDAAGGGPGSVRQVVRSWASTGAELLLDLHGSHRRSAVEDALRAAIRERQLRGGDVLPSSRVLAAELGLARNTVADAYAQLVAEGWLVARPGSGTRVAGRAETPAAAPDPPVPAGRSRRWRHDLSPGAPDLSTFPRSAWSTAARQGLAEAPTACLDYPDPRGHLPLRHTLAGYLARVRGVRTTPERIVITSGYSQALTLVAAGLAEAGATTVAVEAFGPQAHRAALTATGLATRPIEVDGDGAVVAEAGDADAVLLTPAHQFPLGAVLSADRRGQALRWAADGPRLVIEDDYDGEFRYDRKPVGALQGLDPNLVAYAGTTSKSLAPALGLGWLIPPPRLLDAFVEIKRRQDGFTGVFEQLALDQFLRSGGYERHVRRCRLRYRRRRDELVALLHASHPRVEVAGVAAGLHVLLRLPGTTLDDERHLCDVAAARGLGVFGLGRLAGPDERDREAGLVVGYARPAEAAFHQAIRLLSEVLTAAGW